MIINNNERIICENCAHNKICGRKEDYLNIKEQINDIYSTLPKDYLEFIVIKDPECKHFMQYGISVR